MFIISFNYKKGINMIKVNLQIPPAEMDSNIHNKSGFEKFKEKVVKKTVDTYKSLQKIEAKVVNNIGVAETVIKVTAKDKYKSLQKIEACVLSKFSTPVIELEDVEVTEAELEKNQY